MAKISGKTVIVTGASQGLGLEFVRQLLKRNNTVIAAVRKPSADLEALSKAQQVKVTQLDVALPSSIHNWAAGLRTQAGVEHVDYLVNNAGILFETGLLDVTPEELETSFKVNTMGPLLVTQALVKAGLIGPPGTVIANITSKMGSVDDNSSGGYYAYRASKAGLNMVNKSLSIDLARQNVTSVVLHPGYVQTRMTEYQGFIDPSTSVGGMLAVLESNRPLNGRFYAYDGKEIAW